MCQQCYSRQEKYDRGSILKMFLMKPENRSTVHYFNDNHYAYYQCWHVPLPFFFLKLLHCIFSWFPVASPIHWLYTCYFNIYWSYSKPFIWHLYWKISDMKCRWSVYVFSQPLLKYPKTEMTNKTSWWIPNAYIHLHNQW